MKRQVIIPTGAWLAMVINWEVHQEWKASPISGVAMESRDELRKQSTITQRTKGPKVKNNYCLNIYVIMSPQHLLYDNI